MRTLSKAKPRPHCVFDAREIVGCEGTVPAYRFRERNGEQILRAKGRLAPPGCRSSSIVIEYVERFREVNEHNRCLLDLDHALR